MFLMFRILAQLDCLVAFSTAAISGNYVRPNFTEDKEKIQFIDSRHPCVEKQDQINFISNTVQLDRQTNRFQIITGEFARVFPLVFYHQDAFFRPKYGWKIDLHSTGQ